jgi:serine/threonine-protein kinase
MDFGIALAVSAAAGGRMTETGLSLGTPHYMSPEQATADKQITARSDVYSLASVLYEMLTGNPPHVGSSAQQIIMKIIAEPVKPATDLRKSVPAHVAAALAKALEKLPADRFSSAREFATALADANFAATIPQAGGAASTHRQDRRIISLGALAALALAAAAWGWLRPSSRPVPSSWRVTLPLPDSAPMYDGLDISDDGSVVVYSGPARVGILVRRSDAAGFVAIPGTQRTGEVALSPDGRRMAFLRDDGLWVMPTDGGEPAKVVDRLFIESKMEWNGSDAVLLPGPDGIVEAQATGGVPRRVSTLDIAAGEAYHLYPAPVPGGGVVFTIFSADAAVDSGMRAVVRVHTSW